MSIEHKHNYYQPFLNKTNTFLVINIVQINLATRNAIFLVKNGTKKAVVSSIFAGFVWFFLLDSSFGALFGELKNSTVIYNIFAWLSRNTAKTK